MLVLDLYSESRPQWGDPNSAWYRKNGFDNHQWLYCMLLNYGGNVGLHGKMQHVIDEYYKAVESPFGSTMKGIGMTMEGSENNPVMYELLCELPCGLPVSPKTNGWKDIFPPAMANVPPGYWKHGYCWATPSTTARPAPPSKARMNPSSVPAPL